MRVEHPRSETQHADIVRKTVEGRPSKVHETALLDSTERDLASVDVVSSIPTGGDVCGSKRVTVSSSFTGHLLRVNESCVRRAHINITRILVGLSYHSSRQDCVMLNSSTVQLQHTHARADTRHVR